MSKNNYATACSTKLDMNLHVSVRLLQCQLYMGVRFLCLRESEKQSLADTQRPQKACREESGCLLAIMETALLFFLFLIAVLP